MKLWLGLVLGVATLGAPLHAAVVHGQGTWESSLLPRDINGDGIVDSFYDTSLDITWIADARYAITSGYSADGLMSWNEAKTWVEGLTYFGLSGWRLPTLGPKNGVAFNTSFAGNGSTDVGRAKTGIGWGRTAELSYLYYVTLGNASIFLPNDQNIYDTTPNPNWSEDQNVGGFLNTSPYHNYWYGLSYENYGDAAGWCFQQYDGSQWGCWSTDRLNVIAVRDGDVLAVTEPSTLLFIIAGGTLLWRRVRRNEA